MRGFTMTVPLFLPGLAVAVIVALVFGRSLARRLDARPLVAGLLIISLGLIVSATLTPLMAALDSGVRGTGTCDTSRMGWASWSTYVRVSSQSLNVLLFVPLGVAAGLLRGRAALAIIVASFLLPTVVELVQLLAPALGRGCETGDIVDNTTGVALGLMLGFVMSRGTPTVRTSS